MAKTRKLSPWIQLVTKTYNENKHKAGYAFKDAIKDAKKVYTKVSGKVNEVVSKVKKGVTKATKKGSDQKGKGVATNKNKPKRNGRGSSTKGTTLSDRFNTAFGFK